MVGVGVVFNASSFAFRNLPEQVRPEFDVTQPLK